MKNEVSLTKNFSYFSSTAVLKKLNGIFQLHSRFSPDLLMSATGCSFQQALQILILLFKRNLADGFLLIYLRDDPEIYVDKRHISDGLPNFPHKYDYGAKSIDDSSEVLYSFEFVVSEEDSIVFKVSNE